MQKDSQAWQEFGLLALLTPHLLGDRLDERAEQVYLVRRYRPSHLKFGGENGCTECTRSSKTAIECTPKTKIKIGSSGGHEQNSSTGRWRRTNSEDIVRVNHLWSTKNTATLLQIHVRCYQ